MNEPTYHVNLADVLQLLGLKEVELHAQLAALTAKDARIKELEAAQAPKECKQPLTPPAV